MMQILNIDIWAFLIGASDDLKGNLEFMTEACSIEGALYLHAKGGLRGNPEFALSCARNSLSALQHIFEEFPGLGPSIWSTLIGELRAAEGLFLPPQVTDFHSLPRALDEYYNIRDINKFKSLKTIALLYSSLMAPRPADKPIALLLFPRSDWNGAFRDSSQINQFLEDSRFHTMYFEVENEQDLKRILAEVTAVTYGGSVEHFQRPVHTLWIAGHGIPGGLLDLSGLAPLPVLFQEERFLEPRDFMDEVVLPAAGLSELEPEELPLNWVFFNSVSGQVVLHSCSTAAGAGEPPDRLALVEEQYLNLTNAVINSVRPSVRVLGFKNSSPIKSMTITGEELLVNLELYDGGADAVYIGFGGAD